MKLSSLNEYAASRDTDVPKSKTSSYQRSGLATALPKYAPEGDDEKDEEEELDECDGMDA